MEARGKVQALPIPGQPAAAVQPDDGSFDDPAPWEHPKTFTVSRTPDNFNFVGRQSIRHSTAAFRAA